MADFYSIQDILSFAIRLEQASQEFYRHLSGLVDSPSVSGYLDTLIEEEKLHELRLRQVLSEQGGALEASISAKEIECYIQAVQVPASLDYKGAVKIARDKEKAAQMLYLVIAGATADPQLQGVFRQLSAQEKIHRTFFENEYRAICLSEN
jgi:rubrerythrin